MEFIEACESLRRRLRASDRYINYVKADNPLPLQDFVVGLREGLRAVWRELDGADPRTHAHKLATYHAWMASPLKPSTGGGPPHLLPRYLSGGAPEMESRLFTLVTCGFGVRTSLEATTG